MADLIPQTELSRAKLALLAQWRRGEAVERLSTGRSVISPRKDRGPAPLSFGQQQLFFFNQLQPESALYNVPVAMRLTGNLRVPALQTALDCVVARHEIMRTRFGSDDAEPVQIIDPPSPVPLSVVDLRTWSEAQREAEAQ